MPKVSVIMSTHNDSNTLRQSMDSILDQTFSDFEFLIIDDASEDDTVVILKQYEKSDPRVKLLINDENKGLTKNLNKLLLLASGEYIARMDGDDISHLDRLSKQVDYLDNFQDIDLIGTGVHSFGESDLYWRLPDDSDELKIRMLLHPVFAHPSFMFRHKLLNEGIMYDESFRTAQDYDFAARVAKAHKLGRVQEILLEYRVHKLQISNISNSGQKDNANRVRKMLLDSLGIKFTPEQETTWNRWVFEARVNKVSDFKRVYGLIDYIVDANKRKKLYSEEKIEIVLKKMLYTWCIRSKDIKSILAFPYICRFSIKDMRLFVGELVRTVLEKSMNKVEASSSN